MSICRSLVSGLVIIGSCGASPDILEMHVSDSNGGEFGANIVFVGDKAVEYGASLSEFPEAEFDLNSSAWKEVGSGRSVTLTQAQRWAENSRNQSRGSLEQIQNADQKAFLMELISPKFTVHSTEDSAAISSRFFSYEASHPLQADTELLDRIFKFDVLNAYRKAMVLRQFSPFIQLEVTRILREQGFFPSQLDFNMTTPNGNVRVKIRYRLREATPEEEQLLSASI